MAYTPYMSPYAIPYSSNAWTNTMQSPDQIYQTYQQMMQSNPFNPQSQPNAAMNNRGDYIRIKDYSEVETYPCRADGVATLFFNFENMTFYSKKILNGKVAIQPFAFSPMNMTGVDVNAEEAKAADATEAESIKPSALDMILTKMEQMEKTIKSQGKTISTLKKNSQSASKPIVLVDNKENVTDEL